MYAHNGCEVINTLLVCAPLTKPEGGGYPFIPEKQFEQLIMYFGILYLVPAGAGEHSGPSTRRQETSWPLGERESQIVLRVSNTR